VRNVAIPAGSEWITLDGSPGRFYPLKMSGSTVLVDQHGSVWAELFDTDSVNLVFRTLQPMSPADQIVVFKYLVEESSAG
jgi:hypothetical protein